jgi:hypothetical protein
MERVGQRHASAAFPPRKRPGTHFVVGRVGLGVGTEGAEKFTPTGVRTPKLPARSKLLSRPPEIRLDQRKR